MKRIFRVSFVILGVLSFILTIGLCTKMPLMTNILPSTSSFPLYTFLASITASISASLLWIGFSGELGAGAGGALDLAVFYAGLAIFQLHSQQYGSQHLLTGVILWLLVASVSLGIFLWFRRYPIGDEQLLPLPLRISFGGFVVVLLLAGTALLLRVPNVFAWPLNPLSSAIMGCFFLGSACYFLYGLFIPRWHNACGQLWSFLAYDIVLIVPFLLHFATVNPARMPSLIVNTLILVFSSVLALYYLLIKKETRFRLNIKSLYEAAV